MSQIRNECSVVVADLAKKTKSHHKCSFISCIRSGLLCGVPLEPLGDTLRQDAAVFGSPGGFATPQAAPFCNTSSILVAVGLKVAPCFQKDSL